MQGRKAVFTRGVVVFRRILLYNDVEIRNDRIVSRTGLKADRKEEVYGLFIT